MKTLLGNKDVTVKSQIVAGLILFAVMSYILPVNAGMYTNLGVSFGAAYIATAIGSVIGTMAMALMAGLPVGLSTGMGLNAYFVFSVCFGLGFTYANALVVVLIDAVIFLVLTKTGLRAVIFRAIPRPVKMAIPAGIGLFIAFLGLQDSGIIIPDTATGVTLSSANLVGAATWAEVMPRLVTIAALLATIVLGHDKKDADGNIVKKGKNGAVLIVMLVATAVYYLLGALTVPGFFDGFWEARSLNPLQAFQDWGRESAFIALRQGFDFSMYLKTHSVYELVLNLITSGLAMSLCDMFDTNGTLYGCARAGNMLVENPETHELEPENLEKAMEADAWGTLGGALAGVSPVTSFVESGAAVAAGGRTGLTAMVCAICFAAAMFLAPIAQLIPSAVYSVPLIYVGILMVGGLRDLDWTDVVGTAAPAFVTMAVMPFSYNISYGIAFGLITYVAINVLTGKVKQINKATWIVTILFTIMFFTTH